GRHDLKFGGDVRYQRFDQTLFFDINGQFLYTGTGANEPCYGGTVDPTTGICANQTNLFPNYLLGLVDQYGQGSAQEELVRSKAVSLFAQDSWKVRPSLTLNYGLRWELNTPLADAGKKVQTFRPGQLSTIYPCTLPTTSPLFDPVNGITDCNSAGVTPLGLVVPGDKGIPNGLSETYYKPSAPRIGLAWSPSAKDGFMSKLFGGPGKTSIRMGYGIFYTPVEHLVLEQFSAEPPFGGS